eukprot:4988509-Lingulodinium_polyedra.AAC.1
MSCELLVRYTYWSHASPIRPDMPSAAMIAHHGWQSVFGGAEATKWMGRGELYVVVSSRSIRPAASIVDVLRVAPPAQDTE